jgi:hypothetical protein
MLVASAVRPGELSLLSKLGQLWQGLGQVASVMVTAGLMGVLLVLILLVGAMFLDDL